MTGAPKRIWADTDGEWSGFDPSEIRHVVGEYHIARPGQPCSTDEFLGRVSAIGHPEWTHDAVMSWVNGEFTAAMEGLE